MTRWFSIRQAEFGKTFFVGFGFSENIPKIELAVIIVIGPRVIYLGPHK